MNAKERELAQAAASLTVADFKYLEEHGMLPPAEGPTGTNTQVGNAQEKANTPAAAQARGRRSRRRRTFAHDWPEVGSILQADYEGVHYEAEVITAPGCRSGRAVKILIGPAAGQVCRSPTGAMLSATEQQRAEQGLGKKGVANGWSFWHKQD
jgi:hypothetical protein